MRPHLHLFARNDELLESLRPHLGAARAASVQETNGIPRPIPVLVTSTQVGEWLQVRLARELGLSMGFEFLQPANYFARRFSRDADAKAFAESYAFWSPEQLRWRIIELVDSFSTHLGHERSKSLLPRDRFAFAEVMAEQFARYARYRPDWPERWARNQCAWSDRVQDLSSTAVHDEAWQRELWRNLVNTDAPPHPAQLLAERMRREQELAFAPAPLFVVGADLLDPLLLRTLETLAYGGEDVLIYLLLPSLGYLGDIARRDRWRSQMAVAENDNDAGSGHPLLASLGQKAVGTFLLLDSISPDYAEWPDDIPPPGELAESIPLLNRLQSDIRHQRRPAGPPNDSGASDARPQLDSGDHSVRIHSCHSPRRELEVLRDELLRAFADIPDLRPEDVLIAVTDFDVYAPLAESILRVGSNALPVRLTAIPAREANPIAVALLALLRLSLGRLTASELLELLNHAAIQHRLDVAGEPETLAQLGDAIRHSGLTHGLDAEHRQTNDDTGTWRAAMDRHLAGAWFGPVDEARDAAASWVHPVAGDLHNHDAAILRLVRWLTDLAVHIRTWREPAAAAVWEERLQKAVGELLDSDVYDQDSATLRRRLGELAGVSATTKLDAAVLVDWLQPQLENATSLRTTIGGEILLGRLDQIHGLPCRVLAILGLQNGAFPRASRRPAWDLLTHRPDRWDADPRTQDRQLFLDSILAPNDRLILSAANRSLRTPHDGALSSCLDELLRVIGDTVRPAGDAGSIEEQIVVNHRIHPFAREYFGQEFLLPHSFDAEAARIASEIAKSTTGTAEPFFAGSTSQAEALTDEPVTLPIAQLIAFWTNPARAWLRAMQLDPGDYDADDTALDDSPVTLDPLQSYEARRIALGVRLPSSAINAGTVQSRMAANRELPPGSLGMLVWDQCDRAIDPLACELADLLPHTHRTAFSIPIDSTLQINGDVLVGNGSGIGSPWVLVYRPSKYDKNCKYQLEAFILTLAATVHLDTPVESRVLGLDGKGLRILNAIPVTEARKHLTMLATGYREGHTRPLCYSPETSHVCALRLRAGKSVAAVIQTAASVWHKEPYQGQPGGEGTSPAATLAWRDSDPFATIHIDEWIRWATTIAMPLQAWWKNEPRAFAPSTTVTPALSRTNGVES